MKRRIQLRLKRRRKRRRKGRRKGRKKRIWQGPEGLASPCETSQALRIQRGSNKALRM